MQERDILQIRTQFVRNVISRQIENILRKSKGYDINIQFDNLTIVSEDGRTHIYLNGNAETDTKELKRICNNSRFLKDLCSILLQLPGEFLSKLVEKLINGMLKKEYGCTIDHLYIKDKKHSERLGKSYIYLDVDIAIKTKYLEKILKTLI